MDWNAAKAYCNRQGGGYRLPEIDEPVRPEEIRDAVGRELDGPGEHERAYAHAEGRPGVALLVALDRAAGDGEGGDRRERRRERHDARDAHGGHLRHAGPWRA